MNDINERLHRASYRALGLVDHNPLSPTAGCVDRNYWHYQDGKGFSVGSYQGALLGFAAANMALKDGMFASACHLAIGWYVKTISECGSFDEYFRNQRSFCATAYSTLHVLLSHRLLGKAGGSFSDDVQYAARCALQFMRNSVRPLSANQALAARLAWDLSGHGKNPFIIPENVDEGWLSEYGGFDLGYSLKCLDICALALFVFSDPLVRDFYLHFAGKLLDTIHSVVVDYTFAPALGSRGNPHKLMGGLVAFHAAGDVRAGRIARELKGPRFGGWVTAETTDDKYLCLFHLTSLALEREAASPNLFDRKLPQLKSIRRMVTPILRWPQAGVVFCRQNSARVAVSEKTGAVHREDCEGSHTDAGYFLTRNGVAWVATRATCAGDGQMLKRFVLKVEARVLRFSSLPKSPAFRWVLSALLSLPLLGNEVRLRIQRRQSVATGSTLTAFERVVMFENDRCLLLDTFENGFTPLYRLGNWCLNDGHGTRLFGGITDSVTPPTQNEGERLNLPVP